MDAARAKHALGVAASIKQAVERSGLARRIEPPATPRGAPEDPLTLYDQLVTAPTLRAATRQLVADRYYALAVLEAYKCLNNVVKERARSSADGAALMRSVFSPQNPVLRLNDLRSETKRNQQQGYMEIFAGCMVGIRNPRAHEHQYADEADVALEMLMWANHLMRITMNARRVTARKNATKTAGAAKVP